MSGVTTFGYLVHSVGTYLHFDPFSVAAHDGHVQRLVAVRFRHRDPIPYTFGVRTVHLRDSGVDHPTLVFLAHRLVGREDDSYRQQVVHIFKGTLLPHHLLPDRIDGFDARFDGVLVAHACESLADRNGKLLKALHLMLLHGF